MTSVPGALSDEILRKPWKYKGYPVFSKWMSSSDDFFLLRRFGELNVRALLLMQDRIVRKEARLHELDERARTGPDNLGISSSLRKDPQSERNTILDELITLLHQYNEYLVTYSQIKSFRSAQPHQVDNVRNWFWNNRGAISDEEQQFVENGRDVIAVVPKSRSPLYILLEKCEPLVTSTLFRSKPKADQVISHTTTYHKQTQFEAFITAVITITGLALLLGPLWALQFVADNVERLAIITGFVLLFTMLLSSATIAKPFEVLAATAAYTAVLVVFLQMGDGNADSK